ncbi:hypothetical protein GPECTOR_29g40 [Gonium pectorale]|uniref:Uncharacterized protein n=1 Tax=Gonium pectorale TaxID=33097 RepID=A0A150GEK2_GONPE|nr:hypothetical protein GPECTOR_29g40 [Gonium pectorale]|eukprot:KXZ48262.1 hypothetical protein GPECTOR_29g40 [Gonium pectorale]
MTKRKWRMHVTASAGSEDVEPLPPSPSPSAASTANRVLAVKAYYLGSADALLCGYRSCMPFAVRQYRQLELAGEAAPMPADSSLRRYIGHWARRFEETGSVADAPRSVGARKGPPDTATATATAGKEAKKAKNAKKATKAATKRR